MLVVVLENLIALFQLIRVLLGFRAPQVELVPIIHGQTRVRDLGSRAVAQGLEV
jgi:hypothetical protein